MPLKSYINARDKLGVEGSSQLYSAMPKVELTVRLYISLSYPFQCGCFLSHPMYRSHSATFWISFIRNCSTCTCRFSVSTAVGELSSLLCHLGLEPGYFLQEMVLTNGNKLRSKKETHAYTVN